ncbi:spondin-2-like [Strongylocentrotus purpuratus]|uniref:Spondin domain-containing protein n=1 Tax=Strongylocentrotus purpuratus TaxID=7668 RepID=A0A7M7HF66_STRPU|nr:spondin-2-like [Strongylocentrotus purpuratus]
MIPTVTSLLAATFWLVSSLQVASGACRSSEESVTYELTFHGDWSQTAFPKQYPIYRKNAQWSPVLGAVHNSRFQMWKEGEVSSEPFSRFVEGADIKNLRPALTGRSTDVYTTFASDGVPSGVGSTSIQFRMHREFTEVSFAVRIDPSPDWFVGQSSLDLCRSGEWLHDMTLDLYPFDAGTDQGFMFTSPDFPEVPRQPIVEITSRVPSHPANSFFYPRVAHLPRIAHVTLSRVHNAQPAWMRLLQSDRGVAGTEQDNAIPKNKSRFYGLIKDSKATTTISDQVLTPLDCEVTSWGGWSHCDVTCRVGLKRRFRLVQQKPMNHGEACADLVDVVICDKTMALVKPEKKKCAQKHIAKEKKRYMKQQLRNFNTKGKRKYIV